MKNDAMFPKPPRNLPTEPGGERLRVEDGAATDPVLDFIFGKDDGIDVLVRILVLRSVASVFSVKSGCLSLFPIPLSFLRPSARIGEAWDGTTGDHPEIETCDAAAGREAAVFCEKFFRDLAVTVDHSHPAMDPEVAVAQDFRTLQGEEQEHFRRPHADAAQRRERGDHLCVRHLGDGVKVEFARHDLGRELLDVFRLALRNAATAEGLYVGFHNGFWRNLPEQFPDPCENRLRRLAGNLLRDDVLDNGREKVGLNRPADAPDLVDDLPQPPIPRLEVLHLLLAVLEVHNVIATSLSQRCSQLPCALLGQIFA